ncbi:hypothetical protein BGX38DRAFT_1171778 [Terfezia claveryi]|nr:hypothetical protein BGX38DRAFT_1171778 [Terfezia claveryi]
MYVNKRAVTSALRSPALALIVVVCLNQLTCPGFLLPGGPVSSFVMIPVPGSLTCNAFCAHIHPYLSILMLIQNLLRSG